MIELMFEFGADIILVVIRGNDIKFGNTAFGTFLADIEGLKLDKEGVVKEFPDLKDNEEWRKEAIQRFKDKIKSFKNEKEKADYIITDLKKHGYKPKFMKQEGFRRVSIDGNRRVLG